MTQASVVGRDFEFALLQNLSGLGEEEVARAVEELTRRRLLLAWASALTSRTIGCVR